MEDVALLRGLGWFMDYLNPLPHTADATGVLSTAAHARILSIDVSAARASEGVIGVLTGGDVARLSPAEGAVTAWSNFQDPFTLRGVAAGVRELLSGHLCRRTGYAGIVAAILVPARGTTR